ncbi:MAG: uracil-DNA glycosylase [Pseudomonadota bacterium]
MSSYAKIQLEAGWLQQLAPEFEKDYMRSLRAFLRAEKDKQRVIYPKGSEFFNAFNSTPFNQVKVVILGQDPYHGPGQAHGLCFSVQHGVRPPPSLLNIYKELHDDLGMEVPNHGCLQSWADQGVLLLNSVLSVQQAQAASHQGKGWEEFTDMAIASLNEHREKLVFLLWGSYAQRKGQFIDQQRHLVLKAPHPSPLAAHRGFFGCKHFSKTNAYLAGHGLTPIDWTPMDISAHDD